MTPGRLLIGAFRKVEPVVADVTGRLTGTPVVLGGLLRADRALRQALHSVGDRRRDIAHTLMIPTTHDVADVRRELQRVHSSLAEIEARLADRTTGEAEHR